MYCQGVELFKYVIALLIEYGKANGHMRFEPMKERN
jgi:hypothetical protein